MRDLSQIVADNKTTQADIEGGSFVIRDGVRVPINPGIAGEQIDADAQTYSDRSEIEELAAQAIRKASA